MGDVDQTQWPTEPQFNVSGPSTVMLGADNVFQVDMYLPAPVSDVAFEAFTPINFTDVMTLCSVAVVHVGNNFDCLPFENLPSTLYPSVSGLTNHRAHLDIGRVFNAG